MNDFGQNLFGEPVLKRSAFFPAPGIRRRVSRDWAPGRRAFVLGCNPSDGGAELDDPTIKWWTRWFHHWGFGGFDAGNLYPFVSSSPAECRRMADWESNGPDWFARDELHHNLDQVVNMAKHADQVFVCFGNIAWDQDWIEHVVEHIQTGAAPWHDLWCWGKTASGSPTHPMARGKHRIDPLQPAILWRAA